MTNDKNKYVELTLSMIETEINAILNGEDATIYAAYKDHVIICDEQIFAQQRQLTPKTIYIVVKFGNASFDFGQSLLPITINAVSEQNAVDICQKLLFDLATTYTQQGPGNLTEWETNDLTDYVKQLWNTPNVINNFNEINIGFRSLMYMTGTVLIGHNSSPIVELVYNKGLSDQFILSDYMITFSDSYDMYPDTQAFYSTNGIGRTAAKTASYAFSVTLFKVKSDFMSKCRDIKRGYMESDTLAPNGISTRFSISMRDKDDYEKDPQTGEPTTTKYYFTAQYSLVNMTVQQNKGDLPTVSLTFAR